MTRSDDRPTDEHPERKSFLLGSQAVSDLAATSGRRRSEREAVEEGLRLLAEHDERRDAMEAFVEWAIAEWGEPTPKEEAEAARIWAQR